MLTKIMNDIAIQTLPVLFEKQKEIEECGRIIDKAKQIM